MRQTGTYRPGIYSITCQTTGRIYVGQAKNMSRRWTSHRWHLNNGTHRNRHLQNAWTKYGASNFLFAVIESFPHLVGEELRQTLAAAEVAAMRGIDKTYNLMVVGQPSLVASEETRKLWSEERLRRWADPEYRARCSAAQKGRPRAAEVVERIAAAHQTPESRRAKSEHFKALWASEGFREARTKELQTIWQSDGYRERQSTSRAASWTKNREKRCAGLQAMHDDPVRGKLRRERFAATMATKPSVVNSAVALIKEAGRPVSIDEVVPRALKDTGKERPRDSVAAMLYLAVKKGRLARDGAGFTLP